MKSVVTLKVFVPHDRAGTQSCYQGRGSELALTPPLQGCCCEIGCSCYGGGGEVGEEFASGAVDGAAAVDGGDAVDVEVDCAWSSYVSPD